MKILLISGSHPRHFYVHKKVIDMNFECKAVVMKREELIPDFEEIKNEQDKTNMKRHFNDRFEIEKKIYGSSSVSVAFSNIEYIECEKNNLNSEKINLFVKSFKADICIVFGSGMIKSDLLELLPIDTVNVHLGLSPQYKGSATLFWPFYNVEPQFAGATFHKVTKSADAGGILHQCVPKLEKNDKIHDVGVKVVIKAAEDLVRLLELRKHTKWTYIPQKAVGKLFLIKDFKPFHLRVIYDLFENKIVDEYLERQNQSEKPNLIEGLK